MINYQYRETEATSVSALIHLTNDGWRVVSASRLYDYSPIYTYLLEKPIPEPQDAPAINYVKADGPQDVATAVKMAVAQQDTARYARGGW